MKQRSGHSLARLESSNTDLCVCVYLSVVASVEGHPVLPEVLEERREDLGLDVVGLHTVSSTALLHHLGEDRGSWISEGMIKIYFIPIQSTLKLHDFCFCFEEL